MAYELSYRRQTTAFDAELTLIIKYLAPPIDQVTPYSSQLFDNPKFFFKSQIGPNLALKIQNSDWCYSMYLWRVIVWEQI